MIISMLMTDDPAALNINALKIGAIENDRSAFNEHLGTDSSELSPQQIDDLRADVLASIAGRNGSRHYMKTHDNFDYESGENFIPSSLTERAIYIVRNPFDLVLSCAYFFEKSVDDMIDLMNAPSHAIASKTERFQPLLRQFLGSWSNHVSGWITPKSFPILMVRYEDMVRNPHDEIARISDFSGFNASEEKIHSVMRYSHFDILKEQESAQGFRENLSAAGSFFRRGRVGAWVDELSHNQYDRIVRDHGIMARQLGYLGEFSDAMPLILPDSQS